MRYGNDYLITEGSLTEKTINFDVLTRRCLNQWANLGTFQKSPDIYIVN